ncbi:hypothetical protein NLI96_g4462 [Meripilus lineatus]|uniref:AAA+ ATPase domain-containing protein n=1 Tax=Meripilus lineatus TaxID=2056292 RepID=A0AAD5V6T3_9APHY|nr:hypothetical protein NLI96_g4462 [Physisporinus lineatus]
MDSEEDTRMEEDTPVTWPSAKGKGKAADVGPEPYDLENLPWVEKYRPVTLDDVVSHKDITSTIERFIEKNRLPHLLFYGPPGTGKTSTILAVARRIYGNDYKKQILELNASDERGIDVVRDRIKNFAETRTLFSKGYKLIILDEADMMTTAAQAALRRVIEQYTKNVRFCIICNYVNKIIPAIQSRCTRFRFSPLPISEVEKRIIGVIETERVAYDMTGETEVYNCTGNPHPSDIETIVNSMFSDEFTTSYKLISALKTERGLALQDLLIGAYEYIEEIDFKPHARIYLLDFIATTEHRLAAGANEKIQLTALLGAFKNAVELSQRS